MNISLAYSAIHKKVPQHCNTLTTCILKYYITLSKISSANITSRWLPFFPVYYYTFVKYPSKWTKTTFAITGNEYGTGYN